MLLGVSGREANVGRAPSTMTHDHCQANKIIAAAAPTQAEWWSTFLDVPRTRPIAPHVAFTTKPPIRQFRTQASQPPSGQTRGSWLYRPHAGWSPRRSSLTAKTAGSRLCAHTDTCYARNPPSPWRTIGELDTCRDLGVCKKSGILHNCVVKSNDSNAGGVGEHQNFDEQRNALWSALTKWSSADSCQTVTVYEIKKLNQ